MFTIHQTSDSRAAHKIYQTSLAELGYGCPLWYPEPHITGEPHIGDVGYVREGAFVRLFNLNSTIAKHSVQHWPTAYKIEPSLPEDVFTLDKRNAPMGPGRFPSRGVEEIELKGELMGGSSTGSAALSASYACREVQGALLVLKSRAYAESLYDNNALEEYMIREHDNWYTYAKEKLRHRVDQEDIVLVSGWIKAPDDWATAAFSTLSSRNQLAVKGRIAQLFGLSLSRSRHKSYSGPPMERSGERYPKEAGSNAPKDQCVFVKRYKIKKRLGIVRIMVAGAGSHNLPSGNDDRAPGTGATEDSEQQVESPAALFNEGKGTFIEPLDILLEYILEVSEARCAIARDDDLESILGGDACPIDLSTYLRRRRPPVVVNDGRGRISALDLMQYQHNQLQNPRISRSDIERWSNISMDGRADVSFAHVKLPQAGKEAHQKPTRLAYLLFSDTTGITKNQHNYTISRDGSMIALAGRTSEITVWRTLDGLRLGHLREDNPVSLLTSVAFSPDGKHLVSACATQELNIWDIVHGVSISRLQGRFSRITCLAFSPCGRYLATGSVEGGVEIWAFNSASSLYTSPLGSQIFTFAYDFEGRQLAAATEDKVVIYNVDSHVSVRATISIPRTTKPYPVAFSPGGDTIFVYVEGQDARLYTTKRGKEVLRVKQAGRLVTAAAYSPDGGMLATVSITRKRFNDGEVVLHEPSKGARTHVFTVLGDGSPLSFSPDGTFIAVCRNPHDIVVHNAKSGQRVAHLEGIGEREIEIKFLPDSRRLLFAYAGGPLGIINIADTLRVR
ncbi:WD40 repeat domain-containing protein [Phanerochaete sordida]|uniref:WD40 repeat domain-containing protein n=1 Tax=Phanerochaete sordida TaxID=48140 RepID=A0A9P3GGC6_9APHY|nr:WD40 repeat domain-containing protein [Phanerochaete sordida]